MMNVQPETSPLPARIGLPRHLAGLVPWLLLCFSAAALGGLFPPDAWYAQLHKPSWNPPGWVFGPVWFALYTMMAVSAWLVWHRGGAAVHRPAWGAFAIQWALNAAWSPIFFGAHAPGAAGVEIVLLWLAIVATVVAFHRVHRVAALLLLPYLAWVSFAAFLNFTLWRLNS